MIEIHRLTKLDRDRFHELSKGYSSWEKYEISMTEVNTEIVISMHLRALKSPYEKSWKPSLDDDIRYEQMVAQGYSAGAYDDERLIGIAIAEKRVWNRTLWIWEFHIDPQYRGQGIGRELMERMSSIGREAGCRVMVCETQNTNVPAIRFYHKVGFEVGGVDLSYYTNRDITDFEVAIFMKRFLI